MAEDPDPKWSDAHREISRRDNEIDKLVVSDSLTADDTEPWRQSTRIVKRRDAHQQIAQLKEQAGNQILVFGSRTLWGDLLAHGLVDELHLMIGPWSSAQAHLPSTFRWRRRIDRIGQLPASTRCG